MDWVERQASTRAFTTGTVVAPHSQSINSLEESLWERALPAMNMSTQSIAGRARSHNQGELPASEVVIGDLNLAIDDAPDREGSLPDQNTGLLRSLLLSGALHALALLTLVSFSFQTHSPLAPPESIAIQLRIRPSAPQIEPSIVEMPTSTPQGVTDVPPPPQRAPSVPVPLVDVPRIESSSTPAPTTPPVNPERPTLRLLTPQSLRETIDGIADRQATNKAWIDCTPLQERSEFIDCGEEIETHDFSILERNATYEFFAAPETSTTRTSRTIGFMASRADDLEQQILNSDIGGPAIDRFLRELRSTAVDISRSGNVQLEQLRDQMHSNDTTYQQQQRALNPR
ncbi:MAG: hypothetical protein A3H44_13155 [Gammaproteobacteria bacterium RIFCSPLOWO2_02_FULL_57_10]|nr:MAG: hypothetical protein A3H44_13155 [Gammaproteobacteria bacterium RIFCSPLOWO2_02_FULL_57_10]